MKQKEMEVKVELENYLEGEQVITIESDEEEEPKPYNKNKPYQKVILFFHLCIFFL
jgi:hypothetical protein